MSVLGNTCIPHKIKTMKHLYLERCFMPFLRYSSWKCIIKLGATIPLVNTVFPYSLLPLLHCDPVFFNTEQSRVCPGITTLSHRRNHFSTRHICSGVNGSCVQPCSLPGLKLQCQLTQVLFPRTHSPGSGLAITQVDAVV